MFMISFNLSFIIHNYKKLECVIILNFYYRNNQRPQVFYAELKHESIYKSRGGSGGSGLILF
jgi:hypothetical protein